MKYLIALMACVGCYFLAVAFLPIRTEVFGYSPAAYLAGIMGFACLIFWGKK